ncbi:MAG TPA: VIT domain-containing protein [Planctomycetota bacterium]|nr:VIT domain-containing protein [Planctomycetota bacterium]
MRTPHAWRALIALVLTAAASTCEPAGSMRVADGQGSCPLIASAYEVAIAGPCARVTLRQTFRNPYERPIDAVYTFPLPERAAVDRMRFEIDGRSVVGIVLERGQAEQAYADAVAKGHVAARLDQERANIFTQSVGNIAPGATIEVIIGFIDAVRSDEGRRSYALPLVVGPRFIPGTPLPGAPVGTGSAPDSDRVPDASLITPPVAGSDTGHRASVRIELDAGLPMADLHVRTHPEAIITWRRPALATIALDGLVADRDVVVDWSFAGGQPQASALVHRPAYDEDGYVLVQLEPAALVAELGEEQARDLCFLIDVSGSMGGAPLEQARQAMRALIGAARPDDRMQVVVFASAAQRTFPGYVTADAAHVAEALAAIGSMQAGGGTQMMAGFDAVAADPVDAERVRLVVLLSDGYIGNDAEIVRMVATRSSARQRFIGLGIGSSVNRALFDGIAGAGGGLARVLLPSDDPGEAARALVARLRKPQMTGISIDWGGLAVSDILPSQLPDLFAGQPIEVLARLRGDGEAVVTVRGDVDGRTIALPVTLDLRFADDAHEPLAPAWARRAIADLAAQSIDGRLDAAEAADRTLALALRHQIVSERTSFVAVDGEKLKEWMGRSGLTVPVAVPLPAGIAATALPLTELSVEADATANQCWEGGGTGAFMAIGAGGAAGKLGVRSGGGKTRALARHGGVKHSEAAVDAGLRFAKRHQSPDGWWRVSAYDKNCIEQPPCEPGVAAIGADSDVLATARWLLAYLGTGYDHRMPSKYKQVVIRAIGALLSSQQVDGSFARHPQAHAAATLAICEVVAMSGDPAFRLPAERAVAQLIAARIPGADGAALAWADPAAPGRIDSRTTLEALRALTAATAAGIAVGDALPRARTWFDAAFAAANASLAAHTAAEFPLWWDPAGTAGPAGGAAMGLLAATLLGIGADPRVDALIMRVLAGAPRGWPTPVADLRTATDAMFLIGGAGWTTWNRIGRDLLIAAQERGGCPCGSWTAAGTGEPEAALGRLVVSAEATLALEVYYRIAR